MVLGRRFALASAAVSALAGVIFLLVACSQQAEGDRCQLDNNNDDCADGLVCTGSTNLPIAQRGTATDREGRCCPADRTQATVAACAANASTPGGDAAIDLDAEIDSATGVGDAGDDAPSTTVDSGSDAPVDANVSDAPTDANEAG